MTQPLVVLWFLRDSKRIVALLTAYDLVLVVAILLLQQHYVIDLIGGVLVAVLAVAMVDWRELWVRKMDLLTTHVGRGGLSASGNDAA